MKQRGKQSDKVGWYSGLKWMQLKNFNWRAQIKLFLSCKISIKRCLNDNNDQTMLNLTFTRFFLERRKTTSKEISHHWINSFVRIQMMNQSFQKFVQAISKSCSGIIRRLDFLSFFFFVRMLALSFLCFFLVMFLFNITTTTNWHLMPMNMTHWRSHLRKGWHASVFF